VLCVGYGIQSDGGVLSKSRPNSTKQVATTKLASAEYPAVASKDTEGARTINDRTNKKRKPQQRRRLIAWYYASSSQQTPTSAYVAATLINRADIRSP